MTTERDDAELRDAQVSARYRELAHEEPSARLDAAILGAARARATRHRAGGRRWAVPLSLAAVVVLSVLVTTRIQEQAADLEPFERPSAAQIEKPAEPVSPPRAAVDSARQGANEASPLSPPRETTAQAARPAPRAETAPQSVKKRGPVPFSAPASEPQTPAPARAADMEMGRQPERNAAGAAPAPAPTAPPALTDQTQTPGVARAVAPAVTREGAQRSAQEETPEKWLERIAKLRSEGRHAAADETLAEFRRRYPDYRIPDEMRAKVMPR